MQSEPGQQNLLIQPPLGRKRGVRQLRRPLLSIQRVQDESRGRQGARLSTTRRSIQPKNKPVDRGQGDQKRYVTFTETQQEVTGKSPSATPSPSGGLPSGPEVGGQCHAAAEHTPSAQSESSSPSIKTAQHSPMRPQASHCENKERKNQGSVRSSLSPTPSITSGSTSRTCSPLPPPLPVLSTPSRLTPTQIRESPEDEETSGLLQNTETPSTVGEDNGTENPLLTSLLTTQTPSPLPLSPVDLDLDESHV